MSTTTMSEREADRPHDYESERDAPLNGPYGPCAVCGAAKTAAVHS